MFHISFHYYEYDCNVIIKFIHNVVLLFEFSPSFDSRLLYVCSSFEFWERKLQEFVQTHISLELISLKKFKRPNVNKFYKQMIHSIRRICKLLTMLIIQKIKKKQIISLFCTHTKYFSVIVH